MRRSNIYISCAYSVWIIILVSILGSLYLSEVKGFAPCTLCWYQRIFMFPLGLIVFVGIVTSDKNNYRYVLPLAIVGGLIALYHVLLQNNVIPETVAPCTLSGLCKEKYLNYLGFITIPFLSLISFTTISMLSLIQGLNSKAD